MFECRDNRYYMVGVAVKLISMQLLFVKAAHVTIYTRQNEKKNQQEYIKIQSNTLQLTTKLRSVHHKTLPLGQLLTNSSQSRSFAHYYIHSIGTTNSRYTYVFKWQTLCPLYVAWLRTVDEISAHIFYHRTHVHFQTKRTKQKKNTTFTKSKPILYTYLAYIPHLTNK